jgi:ATP-dependent Clp protease ATP-binding subunit ClpX
MSAKNPAPIEIARALAQRVIGQRGAVKEMAVALAKHLAGLTTGNILLIGSSGTGKTTLMRAVETYLASAEELATNSTVVRFHAKVLADEAERGRPGEVVLRRLLERARDQLDPPEGTGVEATGDAYRQKLLERVAHGVVFVDEVDKIRAHVGGEAHAAGIRAQEALLTLIENEAVPFTLPSWLGGDTVRLDSTSILFIAGGAFEGLYDAVYNRVTIGRDRGALESVTVMDGDQMRQELRFSLREWLTNEDLFEYGMTPQFFSRFDSVVLLEDLGAEELLKIFLNTPDSSLKAAQEYFESQKIRLAVSPAAMRLIAQQAAAQPRLGARALKEVFRRVIRDYEFDPTQAQAAGALMLDAPEVRAKLGLK